MRNDHNSESEELLSKIREFKASRAPGAAAGKSRFLQETGIAESRLQRHFGGWSQALKLAGLTPETFGEEKISDDALLQALAELTRSHGHFPSMPELIHARHQKKTDIPSASTIQKRWKQKEARIDALIKWTEENQEYSDVTTILLATAKVPLLPSSGNISIDKAETHSIGSELSDSYLPPVVSCLSEMSMGTEAIKEACLARQININTEFEKRVAIAFQLLGLSVERLGQGQGRVADGIAKCHSEGWAIIYDAKVRTQEFRLLATEERKFKEYIEQSGAQLRNRGIGKIYFAVISSGFTERDLSRVQELFRVTEAKACVLLEADALMRLIEKRLGQKEPSMKWDWLEREMINTRIFRGTDVAR